MKSTILFVAMALAIAFVAVRAQSPPPPGPGTPPPGPTDDPASGPTGGPAPPPGPTPFPPAPGQDPYAPRRQIELNVDPTGASVFAEVRGMSADVRNKMRFKFSVDHFPRFRAQFFHKSGTNETRFDFSWGLDQVIEFVDADFDGFCEGEKIVRKWPLGGQQASHWSHIHGQVTEVDGTKLYSFSTMTALSNGGPELFINATISDVFVRVGNVSLAPSTIKFDIALHKLNYLWSNTTYALAARVITGAPLYKQEKPTPMSQPSVQIDGGAGLFAWKEEVTIQNNHSESNVCTMLSSKLDEVVPSPDKPDCLPDPDAPIGAKSNRMFFTAMTTEQPESIEWDPSVGYDVAIADAMEAGAAFNTASISFMLCSILIAVAIFLF